MPRYLDSQHVYYIQGKQEPVKLILVGYPSIGVEWVCGHSLFRNEETVVRDFGSYCCWARVSWHTSILLQQIPYSPASGRQHHSLSSLKTTWTRFFFVCVCVLRILSCTGMHSLLQLAQQVAFSDYCLWVKLNGFSITELFLWVCRYTLAAHSVWILSVDLKRQT